jgi:mono/diheme cytochrome c family protein
MRLAVASLSLLFAGTAVADARADYLLHCGGCHLPDGRGIPPEVPTLNNDLGIIAAQPKGREYLVRVPGAAQSQIDDEGLARIINWVLREFNADTLPKDFKPLTKREVSRYRPNILADPLKYRAEIWPEYD